MITVGGGVVGSDPVGVAPWLDFTAAIHHRVFDLTPHLVAVAASVSTHAETHHAGGGAKRGINGDDDDDVAVVLAAGCGAWCPNTAPTWEHSHRTIHTTAGGLPLLRALIVVEDANGAELTVLATEATKGAWSSREGMVPPTMSSSWTGSTMDLTLGAGVGWESPPRAVPNDTLSLDVPRESPPLGLSPYTFDGVGMAASSVQVVGDGAAVVYYFPEMVVGVVSLAAGSWSVGAGGGSLLVEYCELLVDPANGTCLRQSGYEANGTVDVFLLPPSSTHASDSSTSASGSTNLTTRFSWRGFQYAVVRAKGAATFRGALGDATAHWTSVKLEPTSSIAFSGGYDGRCEL